MKSIIIGTAGHVDHGKTMLIKAMTGQDTDRLREEKERGISIDLGFAPFKLPSGRLAGVVDVPGHEKFIHNMLAGIGGIDLVVLVVDATEGVMPQTREHLQILQLLEIKKGIIVITKIDLVEEEWLELVQEEIREEFEGTFLEGAPLHRVSVVDGRGIEELKSLLEKMAEEMPSRREDAPFRMPVDRVFSVAGFGTVITGTLLSGSIETGETVEILPSRTPARIRQIQVFGSTQNKAVAGQRVALNLAGIEKAYIERGDVIAQPGFFKSTRLLDARLNLLPHLKKPLVNLAPVHFYLGAKRVVAKILLLEEEELKPGESTLVQCRLDKPVVAHFGDRFIIRSYSPMTTIGGGFILDGQPLRHKRFREDVIESLKILEEGDPAKLIYQKLQENSISSPADIQLKTKLPEDIIRKKSQELINQEKAVELSSGSLMTKEILDNLTSKVKDLLKEHYQKNNLSLGLTKARIKSHLLPDISHKDFDSFLEYLEDNQEISVREEIVSFYGYEITPTAQERKALKDIEDLYLSREFSPPQKKELPEILKVKPQAVDNYINYLLEKGILIKMTEEIFFHKNHYEKSIELLKEHFKEKGELTVSDFRSLLNTSRKYALPLLEHFDQLKLTRRVEDRRVPWKI